MVKVSIIIPTYNERENIRILIPLIHEVAVRSGIDYEIIIVDDDSPDRTWEEALKLSRTYNVKVYVRKGVRGLASAVIYGAKRASNENIIVMDADLQHPPEKIVDIARLLDKSCDIVVASRYMKGGGIEGWSTFRLLESRIAILLAKLLLPPARRTSDPVSGFFGVKRRLLLNPEIKPIGYKILLEVLMKNPRARVCDTPYVFRGRILGESKLGPGTIMCFIKQLISNMIYYIKELIRKRSRHVG